MITEALLFKIIISFIFYLSVCFYGFTFFVVDYIFFLDHHCFQNRETYSHNKELSLIIYTLIQQVRRHKDVQRYFGIESEIETKLSNGFDDRSPKCSAEICSTVDRQTPTSA